MKTTTRGAVRRTSTLKPSAVLGVFVLLGLLLGGCQAVWFWLASQDTAMLPSTRGDLRALRDLSEYAIQVTLDPLNHAFYGSLQLDYTNTETVPLDRLYFRLFPNAGSTYGNGSLLITAASVSGKLVQTTLSVENTVIEVPLPRILATGAKTRVALDFTGVLPLDFGGPEGDAYGIYNQSGSLMMLMNWYPLLAVYDSRGWNLDPVYSIGDAVYSDVALFTVDLTVPENVVVAATGSAISTRSSNGLAFYRYVSGPVRDFALAASSDFLVLQQAVGGTRVSSYFLAGQEAGAQRALEIAAGSLELYSQKFGLYPFTELDVVAAPMRRGSGMEMPGLILLDSSQYADNTTPAFLDLVAHEVSHQWWYSLVGNNVIKEPWLDEALATYSGALYAEYAVGEPAYERIMAFRRGRYDQMIREGWDAPVTGGLADFVNRDEPSTYSPVVYSKGAVFFEALRREIGDAAFFTALQAYATLYRYKIATAPDLLATFEITSGRDLDTFYRQWLY